MKRFVIVLFAFFSNYILPAQDFSPGFIVTPEGDTLKGFLLDRTDAELASGVTFKTTKPQTDAVNYLPPKLTSFGFDNGRIFKRFSVPTTNGDSILVFAKKNLEGKISLY